MSGDVSIDLGAAIPYLMELVKGWFGKDAAAMASIERFEKHFRLAVTLASHVQCVGMSEPIPVSQIYQQTRLKRSPYAEQGNIDIWDLLEDNTNAVIFAGPGDGKTVLMQWFFSQLVSRQNHLPMLFMLRRPGTVNDLAACVKDISSEKIPNKKKKNKIVLLVDGYDEIMEEQRKEVSNILLEYTSLKVGNFYLTCRTFYPIYNLSASHFWIAGFTPEDAVGFATSFLKVYGATINAEELINELCVRGFQSFTEHPLMLALVCILQTTALKKLPHSPLGLIRRAIDTLTLRWDENRGIARDSKIPLDGEERVRCLMRIAYNMDDFEGTYQKVTAIAREHLVCQQIVGVDTRKFLQELSQWYGLLIPLSGDSWGFSHRTIHDFLAARYWVESGVFSVSSVKRWNTRAAYAMSIIPDTTKFLKQALDQHCDMHVLSQCLINNAVFDPYLISKSVVAYFKSNNAFIIGKTPGAISYSLNDSFDFFKDASEPFLEQMVIEAIQDGNNDAAKLVLAYALFEFINRDMPVHSSTYSKTLQYIGHQRLTIDVKKGLSYKTFTLDQLKRK